jgi:hypothetical protein
MKWLQAAVLLVTAAHFVNLFPTLLNFERFAFGDCGWSLTVDALLDEGQQPVIDFAYFYGLLTLLVDRVAFALFGRTPETVVGFYAVCALAVAIGIIRTMRAVKLRFLPALFLVSCAALSTIPRGFPSPAHALEAALLVNAIAEHAAGRLGCSLALVVIAAFVKPALAYVYGLILLVLILSRWQGGASRWRRLLPAAVTGVTLLIVLTTQYGWTAVVRTQIPLDGMRVYSDGGVGFFFGAGQLFWLPEEPTARYYFLGVPGIWLASSIILLVSAVRLLPRLREPVANVVITCAILHLTFVCVLFGNQWSWIYYSYILFVGAALSLNSWPPRIAGVFSLVLVVLACFGQAEWLWRRDSWAWEQTHRTPETAGLYASPSEVAEWTELRNLGKTQRVMVLTPMGCAHLLAPEIDCPRCWCLNRRIMTLAERDGVRRQIEAADWIVSPGWHDNDLMRWPEFAEVLRPFLPDQPVRETRFCKLYRRTK